MWKNKLRDLKDNMNKLHIKLTVFFVLLVCAIMIIETYRYNSLQRLVEETEQVFVSSEKIISITQKVDMVRENYEKYLASKDKKDKNRFNTSKNNLESALNVLNIKGKYSDKNIKNVNLYNMVSYYVEFLEEIVNGKKKANNINIKEAAKLYHYIEEYSNEIMGEQLQVDSKEHASLKKEIKENNIRATILSAMAVIIAILCIILFSIGITAPIRKLSDKTKKVAQGNYNLTVFDEDASGEVGELYASFNEMTRSIRENVDEIKRSRMLEQALAKEKINNLNMQKALKEAEFSSLQAMVNPHFLFNTINIGSQLAMLNDDDKTCEYLQNAAELFRYNLNGLDYNTSLDKEINNVDHYIKVMQTRYGDTIEYNKRFDFNVDVDKIIIPKMTLQPLVEFLYINSVNSLEEGGMIKVLVNQNDKNYIIDILSGGNEIEQTIINGVMFDDNMLDEQTKTELNNSVEGKEYYMSILGVKNAVKRLRLLYERKDVIYIRRDDDINYITIKIPIDAQLFIPSTLFNSSIKERILS